MYVAETLLTYADFKGSNIFEYHHFLEEKINRKKHQSACTQAKRRHVHIWPFLYFEGGGASSIELQFFCWAMDRCLTDEMAEELLWSLGVGKHLPAYLQESRHRSQPLGEGRGRGAWWNMESFCKVPQLGNYTISFWVEELSEIVLYWKGLSMWSCDLMWFIPEHKTFVESTLRVFVPSRSTRQFRVTMFRDRWFRCNGTGNPCGNGKMMHNFWLVANLCRVYLNVSIQYSYVYIYI